MNEAAWERKLSGRCCVWGQRGFPPSAENAEGWGSRLSRSVDPHSLSNGNCRSFDSVRRAADSAQDDSVLDGGANPGPQMRGTGGTHVWLVGSIDSALDDEANPWSPDARDRGHPCLVVGSIDSVLDDGANPRSPNAGDRGTHGPCELEADPCHLTPVKSS